MNKNSLIYKIRLFFILIRNKGWKSLFDEVYKTIISSTNSRKEVFERPKN